MERLTQFVENWGYFAVFLGSLVEGESVILTASALASFGYLSIYKIMIIAFIGTTLSDQALYFVGRHYGPSLFDRFPRFKKPADHAFVLLNRYDIWFIISCRFIYGIRTISAVVIGASGIPASRFIPLNLLSALIWTIVSCVGGYLLGDVMFRLFTHFETAQKYLIGGVILIGLIILGFFIWRKKKSKDDHDKL